MISSPEFFQAAYFSRNHVRDHSIYCCDHKTPKYARIAPKAQKTI